MNSRPKHPVRDYAFGGGDRSGTSMSDNMVFTLGLRPFYTPQVFIDKTVNTFDHSP